MKLVSTLAGVCLLASTAALAQQPAPSSANPAVLTSVPAESATVTNYYKQNVYDKADNKIGEIKDVLVDADGKITALIVAAGGFLGMGEHDVAVPFKAVSGTNKNGKWYLAMDASKEALKSAPGLKYAASIIKELVGTL